MPEPASYAWRVLSVVGLASVVVGLNTSTLNVALPVVARHFGASSVASSWLLLSFMLANCVSLVFFGRLADIFGRREMYLIGLSVFTACGLLAGLAPTVWVLVGLRLAQGASAAMMLANSAALVTSAFPPRLLGRGMGLYLASFSLAQLIGPTAGGLLADGLGWRWVFWFNVPLGLACVAWGAVALRPVTRRGGRERLDLPGNALFLAAMATLVIGVSLVTESGWGDPRVLALLGAGLVALVGFLGYERRVAEPVVDPRLLRDPAFGWANLAAFLNAMARFSIVVLFALYFQITQGDSAFAAGLKVLGLPIGTMLGSSTVGWLTARRAARSAATLGALVATVGLLVLLPLVVLRSGYWPMGAAFVLIGWGSGVFLAANTTAILEITPGNRLGIVNALRVTIQNVGVLLSTAVSLTMLAVHLPPELRSGLFAQRAGGHLDPALAPLQDGYRDAMIVLCSLSVLGLAACVVSSRTLGSPRAVDDARVCGSK